MNRRSFHRAPEGERRQELIEATLDCISEFGLKDAAWDYDSNRTVVRDALSIFGPERCMFASNFPVAGLRIPYGELVRAIARMVNDLPEDQRSGLFWANAARFYRLSL